MLPGHGQSRPTVSNTPCLTDIERQLAEVLAAARDIAARCELVLALVTQCRAVEGYGPGLTASLADDAAWSRELPSHNGHSNGSTAPALARVEAIDAPHYVVTPREMQVVQLIAAGLSNKEIASTLDVSGRTVERHITNLYRKIGARGKADATAWAVRHCLG
jgi:DNA-binding CsgD family transcriptional regulator